MKILLNWFASESLSLSSILKYFSFQIIIVVDYIKSPLYNQPEHNKIHVKFMLNISSVYIMKFQFSVSISVSFSYPSDKNQPSLCLVNSIFVIFIFLISGVEIYNKEFSLKYVVKNISKYSDKTIIAYKFSDMINLKNEIKKEILLIENKEEIEQEKNIKLIVVRNKYIKDLNLKKFKVIYKNKSYFLLYKY